MNSDRKPENPKHRKREGARYETCKQCGEEWNVSVQTVLDWRGYLCPRCRNTMRREKQS